MVPLCATLAILGNSVSILLRAFHHRHHHHHHHHFSFYTLLSHLSVCDAVMGVYLAMLSAADRLYQGSYAWKDNSWRNGAACKMAAFLFLLSVETSSFLACLISVERAVAPRLGARPSQVKVVTHAAATCCWVIGAVLSTVVSQRGDFSSQSALCLPVPFTDTPGSASSSLSATIYRQCVVQVLVVVAQACLYWQTRGSVLLYTSSDLDHADSGIRLARRFTRVAVCRAVCWVAVALLGWAVSTGSSISTSVKVAVAVVVVPLGGPVLHPLLYVYAVLLERRQRAQHERLMQYLKARSRAKELR